MTGALLLVLLASAAGGEAEAPKPPVRGVISSEDRLRPIVRRPPERAESAETAETTETDRQAATGGSEKPAAGAEPVPEAEGKADATAGSRAAAEGGKKAAAEVAGRHAARAGVRRTQPTAEDAPPEEPAPAAAEPIDVASDEEEAEEEEAEEAKATEQGPADADLLAGFSDLDDPYVRPLRKALHERPDSIALWIDLGNAYARLHHSEEALAAYDRALALDPDSTAAWGNRGGVLLSVYRDKEAVAAFEEAVRTDFYDAMAHYNLGVAHDRLGDYDPAIHHYQLALTLDPTLKIPSVNPNIVNNRHVQVLQLRLYRDAGGALTLPLRPGGSP